MVIPETVIGRPARKLATRATFIPCSASGMAQPRMTSSISDLSSCGTRSSAPLMAKAARSSGRVVRRVPRGALPTAVRTADAMMTSFMVTPKLCGLIPQRLSCLQRKRNPFLRLLLSAERKEGFAFEIKQVLFRNWRTGCDFTSAQRIRDPIGDLHIVIRDVLPLAHRPDGQLQCRQNTLSW